METTYKGINYGMHDSNLDTDNGIRYGVINQNAVGQVWYDESEAFYGPPLCPSCFNEVDETADFSFEGGTMQDNEGNEVDDEYFCTVCEKGVDGYDPDIYPDEPLSWFFQNSEYSAECDSMGDIFITKSPYFTYAQFCSPCAPGAVHLENPLGKSRDSDFSNNKGYCFGHDWFENNIAPYDVFSVETGKLVSC